MGTNSKIEWTDHTWNPWRGCTKVSPACDNCYMYRESSRYGFNPAEVVRTSIITFRAPLVCHGTPHVPMQADSRRRREKLHKWADGDKVFVCSWSDFFHPDADEWRGEAWEIIRQRPGLVFQILTKRPERIAECLPDDWGNGWPNVWLGVTAEYQGQADMRIPFLLSVPAAKRFVSIEPMLGPVNFRWTQWAQIAAGETYRDYLERRGSCGEYEGLKGIDWIICGGESGPNARPLHPGWVRTIRDQCQEAKVPFMFKQWGEWYPIHGTGVPRRDEAGSCCAFVWVDDSGLCSTSGCEPDALMLRIGRASAGCHLDGRVWKEFPLICQEEGVQS